MARDTSDTSAQMDLSGYSRVAQDCRQPASPRLRAMVSGRVANVGEWCDHHADRLSRERAALVASIARAERLSSGGSAAAREMADRLVADRSARIAEIDGLLAEIAAYRAGTDTDPDRLGEAPIRTPSQTRATVTGERPMARYAVLTGEPESARLIDHIDADGLYAAAMMLKDGIDSGMYPADARAIQQIDEPDRDGCALHAEPTNLDLDVDTPDKVADVLRRAAERFHESAVELSSAWQDPNAGRVWTHLARILESAADKADKAVEKHA